MLDVSLNRRTFMDGNLPPRVKMRMYRSVLVRRSSTLWQLIRVLPRIRSVRRWRRKERQGLLKQPRAKQTTKRLSPQTNVCLYLRYQTLCASKTFIMFARFRRIFARILACFWVVYLIDLLLTYYYLTNITNIYVFFISVLIASIDLPLSDKAVVDFEGK